MTTTKKKDGRKPFVPTTLMLLLYLLGRDPVESIRALYAGVSGALKETRVKQAKVTFVNLRMSLRYLRERGLVTFERGARNRLMAIRLTQEGTREAERQRKILAAVTEP